MRKIIILFITTACLYSPTGIANASRRAPPPDAGVSDEELSRLGKKAIDALIDRLQDPRQENHYEGLVHRLNIFALESNGMDDRIFRALKTFVEKNSQREDVSFKTVSAMYHGLRAMGYTGGERGVDYLIAWIQQGHKKVRCRDKSGNAKANASELRDAAILGLGFSGHPKARNFLEEQAKKQPDVPYKGSFQGAVKDALKYSKEIEKQGVKEFLLPILKGPEKTSSKQP